MKFSPETRAILINQYRLLKSSNLALSLEVNQAIEILTQGYAALYPQLFPLTEEMPRAEGQLVFEVLLLFEEIEKYQVEHPQDLEIKRHPRAHFQGFEAVLQARYVELTQFLFRFYPTHFPHLQSAAPVLAGSADHLLTYEKMVRIWRLKTPLDRPALWEVLNAGLQLSLF